MKTIVLTGGGTAGHVTPNLALLPKLQKEGWDIRYIGSHTGIEKELVQMHNIPYYPISSGKLRRYIDIKNISDPFKVIKGFWDAVKVLRKLKPNVVFSKGGYVTVPVVVAANFLKIPVVIHESDITPGLANKISIPFAKTVCVNFPETISHIKGKAVLTGTPIREELFLGSKESGLKLCRISNDKPNILVMGGSQGSVRINNILRSILLDLTKEFNVIHICGRGNVDKSKNELDGYIQFEYIGKELKDIFAITDLMVTRAGANAIAEITSLKIPALLIPLSLEASRGDQILNANSMEKQGFCKVLKEEDMDDKILLNSIKSLYNEKDKYIENMNNASSKSGIDLVLAEIKKVAR